jgi:hypothetical protein
MDFILGEKKKIYRKKKFIDFNDNINIELFKDNNFILSKKNQIFSIIPSYDLVKNILKLFINNDTCDNIYFEFSRKDLEKKKVLEKFNTYIDELKKIYLPCKHKKYLQNINEKKFITILRQIIKPYNYFIEAKEKYENGKKFLLYILNKKNNISFKKIDSIIIFD